MADAPIVDPNLLVGSFTNKSDIKSFAMAGDCRYERSRKRVRKREVVKANEINNNYFQLGEFPRVAQGD